MIEFKQVNKFKIIILMDGKHVGRIFTPASSGNDIVNAIQVCGFDDAYDLWACGIHSDVDGNPKKDIQLMFSKNSLPENNFSRFGMADDCAKCFRNRQDCFCKDLIIKSSEDLPLIHINHIQKMNLKRYYKQLETENTSKGEQKLKELVKK